MPVGFCWIIDQKLAGAGQPGLIHDIAEDYSYYKNLGISFIVNLTENIVPPSPTQYGFREKHFPINDMSIPNMPAAHQLCQEILTAIDEGETVLLHCKAGLGRTGTILACCLVLQGKTAIDALQYIRIKNSSYVQTTEQEEFIDQYQLYCQQNKCEIDPQKVENKQVIASKDPIEKKPSENRLFDKFIEQIPDTVATAIIDLQTQKMTHLQTIDNHPQQVIDLLYAATEDMYQGPKIQEIEQLFCQIRQEQKPHYFKEIIVFSKNLIHYFSRFSNNPHHIAVIVCRTNVNLANLVSKARSYVWQ
ncbi:phosphatase domain-containing putative toxin [Candidatus Uabimicrobium amorphum]|uniref:Protein phosphatase-like protein n=1 Tax=Uabimicrobium amorphum TaxID=2596890 RepID=A0A5S9IJX7_UABAM|nr:dual specificity protein phosphatase family protein [Candidatus Uabimicrobium amorphum]BBM82907.1 protein phosphatase-like protein [Candidatus Uabimicrobium amorphum]